MNITKSDLISLVKGLGIALVGAALTYLTAWVGKYDFGSYTPLVVAFWGVVANFIRKLIDQPVQDKMGISL